MVLTSVWATIKHEVILTSRMLWVSNTQTRSHMVLTVVVSYKQTRRHLVLTVGVGYKQTRSHMVRIVGVSYNLKQSHMVLTSVWATRKHEVIWYASSV